MSLLPDFLIIGAAKAGTTFLWSVLRQHPEIFMCRLKEPRFFAFADSPPQFGGPDDNDYTSLPTITGMAEYQALFSDAPTAAVKGEASTIYSYYPGERPAETIRRLRPDIRLIMVLRHPLERAFSNFIHARSSRWEPLSDFRRALDDEDRRRRENWSPFLFYRQNSDYQVQLERYYARFKPDQIRVYLYEDLCSDPLALCRDIFLFLGVNDSFVPQLDRRINVSRNTRLPRLDRLIHQSPLGERIRRLPRPLRRLLRGGINRLNRYRPKMDPELHRRLSLEFNRQLSGLQKLIDRNLSHWEADNGQNGAGR